MLCQYIHDLRNANLLPFTLRVSSLSSPQSSLSQREADRPSAEVRFSDGTFEVDSEDAAFAQEVLRTVDGLGVISDVQSVVDALSKLRVSATVIMASSRPISMSSFLIEGRRTAATVTDQAHQAFLSSGDESSDGGTSPSNCAGLAAPPAIFYGIVD